MMLTMLYLSILVSISFFFVNHPLSMGLILLTQTVIISLILGMHSFNFWYSYILFMIMVGGMLVLFIYMTSIASNEKFKFSKKIIISWFVMSFMMIMLTYKNWMVLNLNEFSSDQLMMFEKNSFELSFMKYYNIPTNIILATLIIYLFITLIAVVKITNVNYGPLRQKF